MAFHKEYEYLIPSRSVNDFSTNGATKIHIDLNNFFATSPIKILNWCSDTHLAFHLFDKLQLNKFCRDVGNWKRIRPVHDLDDNYNDLRQIAGITNDASSTNWWGARFDTHSGYVQLIFQLNMVVDRSVMMNDCTDVLWDIVSYIEFPCASKLINGEDISYNLYKYKFTNKRCDANGHFSVIKSPDPTNPTFNSSLVGDLCFSHVHFERKNLENTSSTHDQIVKGETDFNNRIHNKACFLEEIKLLAKLKMDKNNWDVVIVYTGHGVQHSGDWFCGGGETVSFDEVMSAWVDSLPVGDTKNFTLVMDSCFSGAWAENLRYDRTSPRFKKKKIALICSSTATQTSSIDVFISNFLNGTVNEIQQTQTPVYYTTQAYDSALFTDQLRTMNEVTASRTLVDNTCCSFCVVQ